MISQETIQLTQKLLEWLQTIDEETEAGLLSGELVISTKPVEKETDKVQEQETALVTKKKKRVKQSTKKIEVEVEVKIEEQEEPVEEIQEEDEKTKQLKQIGTREEAKAYIETLGLTVPGLKAWAKELNVYIRSSDRKGNIVDKIVEGVVGSQLRSKALGSE